MIVDIMRKFGTDEVDCLPKDVLFFCVVVSQYDKKNLKKVDELTALPYKPKEIASKMGYEGPDPGRYLVGSLQRLKNRGLIHYAQWKGSNYITLTHLGISFISNTKKSRASRFKREVIDRRGKYPMEMVTEFVDYWTEEDQFDIMRFEVQDRFKIPNRLATWFRNAKAKGLYNTYELKR